MRHFAAALLLLLAAEPAVPQQAPDPARPPSENRVSTAADRVRTSTVWGQVRSDRGGSPLAFAVIELVSRSAPPMSVVTDSNGVYVLRGVPAGRRVLRATHFDHAPHEVEILVTANRQETIDFDLEFRPVRLTPVTAEGTRGLPSATDTVALEQPELGQAAARALESSPGVAELGLVEAARDAPGYEPVDPSDVLYVRGGAADLKLVMLNGAPVYAPFHVGGLIQPLDGGVLRSANLYVGGAPARFDGGLSYIMDLETRSGRDREAHGEIGIDLLSGQARLEGPLGERVTFLAAGRMVHGKGTEFMILEEFPYAYSDVVARVDVRLAPGHNLTASGFFNDELVRLDTVGGARERAMWGNRAGSVRYRGGFGATQVMATVALAHFRTTLPLGGIRPLMTEGTALRGRTSVDFEQPAAGARIFWGASLDHTGFEYRAFPQAFSRDSALVQNVADGLTGGVYAEAAVSLLPRLRVRAGMRADAFTHTEGVKLAPRASATLLLTDRAAVTVMAGRYRQYVRTPERSLVFLGNVAPDSAAAPPLTVAAATHFVLSLTQDLGEGIRLGLEGFYKEFEGLHATPDRTTEASGVDLWLRRNTGSFTGWLGYSLAWVWSMEPDQPRPAHAFSGRHLVTSGVSGPLIGNGAFDVRVSYGAGLPYTAVPEPPVASPNFSVAGGAAAATNLPSVTAADPPVVATEPQDPFIRLDAQVSRTWNGSFGDVAYQFTPYLKVINALNRRDAIFYHYSQEEGRAEPVAGLPVMPILGLQWRF
jgi:hypothetical protein